MSTDFIFAAVCAVAILIMIVYYMKCKKRLRAMIFGALTGLAALFILNKFGGNFDTELPLNTFNVIGSAILGVPFVICMVILRIM